MAAIAAASRAGGKASCSGMDCHPRRAMAGVEGLEPPTPGFGDRCSNQLSYTPTAREAGGALPSDPPRGCKERQATGVASLHISGIGSGRLGTGGGALTRCRRTFPIRACAGSVLEHAARRRRLAAHLGKVGEADAAPIRAAIAWPALAATAAAGWPLRTGRGRRRKHEQQAAEGEAEETGREAEHEEPFDEMASNASTSDVSASPAPALTSLSPLG